MNHTQRQLVFAAVHVGDDKSLPQKCVALYYDTKQKVYRNRLKVCRKVRHDTGYFERCVQNQI